MLAARGAWPGAATHPDAFRSVVIINSGIWPDYRWHLFARIWRTPMLGELFMALVTRRGFQASVQYGNRRQIPAQVVERWYRQYDRGTRHTILRLYRATNPSTLGYAQVQVLRPLDRPALVIWGKRDPYLPFWLAERQRDAFPRAHVVVLPNSGHFPFVDDPDTVRGAILPFLRQQLAG